MSQQHEQATIPGLEWSHDQLMVRLEDGSERPVSQMRISVVTPEGEKLESVVIYPRPTGSERLEKSKTITTDLSQEFVKFHKNLDIHIEVDVPDGVCGFPPHPCGPGHVIVEGSGTYKVKLMVEREK